MKKLLFLLLANVVLVSSYTQKYDPLSIAVFYGYQINSNLRWKSFENYMNSYNNYYSNFIASPFKSKGLKNSFVFGMEYQAGVGHVGLMYGKSSQDYRCVFKNGESRNVDIKYNYFKPYISFVFAIIKLFEKTVDARLEIGSSLGGNFQSVKMENYYVYSNGITSFGGDDPTNGVYRIKNDFNPIIGPRIDVGIKWIRLSLRAEYQGLFHDYIYFDTPSNIEDISKLEITRKEYENLDNSHLIGQDYKIQMGNNGVTTKFDKNIYGSFRGFTFYIILRVAPLTGGIRND